VAARRRVAGPALYLLQDDLPEFAETHRHAGAALAVRVAELGGAGDPTELVELSRLGPFELPADTSNPAAITDYALERVRGLIGAYGEALGRTSRWRPKPSSRASARQPEGNLT
jgi:hypothetical protein